MKMYKMSLGRNLIETFLFLFFKLYSGSLFRTFDLYSWLDGPFLPLFPVESLDESNIIWDNLGNDNHGNP